MASFRVQGWRNCSLITRVMRHGSFAEWLVNWQRWWTTADFSSKKDSRETDRPSCSALSSPHTADGAAFTKGDENIIAFEVQFPTPGIKPIRQKDAGCVAAPLKWANRDWLPMS